VCAARAEVVSEVRAWKRGDVERREGEAREAAEENSGFRLRSARWRERPGGEGATWGSDVIVWWSCRARAGFEVVDGRAIAWCEAGALESDPLSLDGCPSIVE